MNEEWDDDLDGKPLAPSIPVGVPGAVLPSQITGHKPSFAPAGPTPLQKDRDEKEFDVSTELSGFGLQGVRVTEEDLLRGLEGLVPPAETEDEGE